MLSLPGAARSAYNYSGGGGGRGSSRRISDNKTRWDQVTMRRKQEEEEEGGGKNVWDLIKTPLFLRWLCRTNQEIRSGLIKKTSIMLLSWARRKECCLISYCVYVHTFKKELPHDDPTVKLPSSSSFVPTLCMYAFPLIIGSHMLEGFLLILLLLLLLLLFPRYYSDGCLGLSLSDVWL